MGFFFGEIAGFKATEERTSESLQKALSDFTNALEDVFPSEIPLSKFRDLDLRSSTTTTII